MVNIEFKVEDAEESMMMQSLMDSMNPDKLSDLNEVDFNSNQGGVPRTSMMIHQGATNGVQVEQARALAGAGLMHSGMAGAPAPVNPGMAN